LLLAGPAWAQVQVDVRTEKPQFLAGEPIFVIAEVKNVGTGQSGRLPRSLKAAKYLVNGTRGAIHRAHAAPLHS